jgi:hypothetical protein
MAGFSLVFPYHLAKPAAFFKNFYPTGKGDIL